MAEARRHRDAIGRANVLIKVPGTEAGVGAFEELTAAGVNVNVTLLFAVVRYEEIAEAYLRGLERRLEAGEPVDRAASVASFFVSRVDTKVDEALGGRGREDLRGKAAVANAKLAYRSFTRIFSGERWERLVAAGAAPQRPLWGSTSTKNPDYPDTLYVDELIGPHTVNTMPDATIEAARDHATAERTIDRNVEAAEALMREVRDAGVDVDDIVDRQLVDEGVKAFADSYESCSRRSSARRPSSGPALGAGTERDVAHRRQRPARAASSRRLQRRAPPSRDGAVLRPVPAAGARAVRGRDRGRQPRDQAPPRERPPAGLLLPAR